MFDRWNKVLCLLALSLLLTPVVHADGKPAFETYEAWFVMNMSGKKSGYMHIQIQKEGDTLVTQSKMKIAIKRGQAQLEIEQGSRFVETMDFKPITAESTMKLATMTQHQKLTFSDDKWVLTSTVAGNKSSMDVEPAKTDWLTPGGLDRFMREALKRGDKEIEVSTIDLAVGAQPMAIKMKRGEKGEVEVFGKVVPATQWTMTMPTMPGIVMTQWSDEAGQPVRQTVPLMPGMEMEMLLADKALATSEFDAPEMLEASLITPSSPIKRPRKLKHAVYLIKGKDLKEQITDTVPNTSVQTARWTTVGDMLRIEINLKSEPRISKAEPGKEYLAATSMLNHEDEALQTLLTQWSNATFNDDEHKAGTKSSVKARTLREFVRDHIDAKNLSVGFATASETARTKQGDCTEHACLLAAMLRGAGIPSRTVTGLVYADQFVGHEGVFGFHMWTQAWIRTGEGKGYWLDLDAAMPGDINDFDATHIALSTSSMKDGETFNEMIQMMPLMQGMEIMAVQKYWE